MIPGFACLNPGIMYSVDSGKQGNKTMIMNRFFIPRKFKTSAPRLAVKDRVSGFITFIGSFDQCCDWIALHQGLVEIRRPH